MLKIVSSVLMFDVILELRRINARSIVGCKDVFLSYAHVNINFARKVKVRTGTAVASTDYLHCVYSVTPTNYRMH